MTESINQVVGQVQTGSKGVEGKPEQELGAGQSQKKQEKTVSLHPETPVSGIKVKVGQPINLLSDTGLAVRKMRWRTQVFRVTGTVIGLCTLLTVGSFGFWIYQQRSERAVNQQISVTEQQLVALGEINTLAQMYDQRLKTVSSLVIENGSLPTEVVQEVLTVANSSQVTLRSLQLHESNLELLFALDGVQALHRLLNEVKEKELSGRWSKTRISKTDIREIEEITVLVVTVVNPTVRVSSEI
jgi:hypothetical protein